MDIKTAILTNEATERDPEIRFWTGSREAIKLGNEALKRTIALRISGRDYHLESLPGETKE